MSRSPEVRERLRSMPPLVTRQRVIAQLPYLIIGLFVTAGFVLIVFEYWRRGL